MQNQAQAEAAQPMNYQLLRLYIDTIPNFNGTDNCTLEIFLEHCQFLVETYSNRRNRDDPINGFLIRAVISKLTGNALTLVGSRPEIRDWIDLKNLLRLTFGDQRNIDCLVQEMLIMKPFKNESFVNFGQRIQKCRSQIASKLKSLGLPVQECTFKLKNYDELALKTFIRGLTGRVQDMVRLRDPDTLEVAISHVIEEENFMLAQRQSNFIQNSFNTKQTNNIQRPVPANQNNMNRFPFSNFQPTNFNTAHSFPYQNFARPNFINRHTLPNPFNNYTPNFNNHSPNFNNSPFRNPFPNPQFRQFPNFKPPMRDVFRPTGQVPTNKPEPMSTSTRNSNAQNSGRKNFFQPSGPRNFYAEELHNIETNEVGQTYSDNNYYLQNDNSIPPHSEYAAIDHPIYSENYYEDNLYEPTNYQPSDQYEPENSCGLDNPENENFPSTSNQNNKT